MSNNFVERLDALDEATRTLVLELASALAVQESVQEVVVPESVTRLGVGETLLQQLHNTIGATATATISASEIDDDELNGNKGEEQAIEPEGPQEASNVPKIELFLHPHTPVEMRNFISLVMPAGRPSDEAFSLGSRSASLLAHTLITIYDNLPLYINQRHTNASLITRHIGLHGRPVDAHDLYPTQPQRGVTKVNRIIESMDKDLSIEIRTKALELAQDQNEDEILAFIQQSVEGAQRAHAGIEAEPIPEGFDRKIIKDINGKQHAILWNTETLNIIIDGTEYPAANLGNVYRDRLKVIKFLLRNRDSSFSSSQLHNKGIGKLGKQTEAAVKQAIRMTLKEVEQITVQVGSETVPLLGYASPRTYQLHEQLGGPEVDQKRFAKSGGRNKKQASNSDEKVDANDKQVRLIRDGIVINGVVHEVFDEAERDTLRPIVETRTRTLEIDEVSGLAFGVNEPTDVQIEDTRLVLYELTRRGIVTKKVVDGSTRYIVNENAENFLEELTDLDFGNGNVVYLRQWDIEIVKAFMLSARPLDFHEVARRLQPAERLPADDFKDLVLTIRDYLAPHGIVYRERLPIDQGGATTDRFLMPDKMKNDLTESGIII